MSEKEKAIDSIMYGFIDQMAEETQSLWRIRFMYKRDSEQNGECLAFWEKMEKAKEEQIKELQRMVMKYVQDNKTE